MAKSLVRIAVVEDGEENGEFLGYAWGLLDDGVDEDEFYMIYTRSKRVIGNLGSPGFSHDISDYEANTAIDVDDCWTPSIVYAEAAKRVLSGSD